jgi:hypothetical protein
MSSSLIIWCIVRGIPLSLVAVAVEVGFSKEALFWEEQEKEEIYTSVPLSVERQQELSDC